MNSEVSHEGDPVQCPQDHLILAAVDESENSLRAVDYLARWAACGEGVRTTLVHVVREAGEDIIPGQAEREEDLRKKREAGDALLADVKERLESLGVPASHVTTKILLCRPPDTVAEVLLEEKSAGSYDTMVLGRRGMSKKEEYIFGSVTTILVREASDVSVWVVA
jgi:nucleotide-binding universal stress UspA family protein